MMDEREVLVLASNGERRIVAVWDGAPCPPEDDGQAPILQIESSWGSRGAEAVNPQAEAYADAYNAFWKRDLRDAQGVFERWLRIFHGTKSIVSFGPNQTTDCEYLCFDTDEWAETVGCPDRFRATSANMDEYVAYLEGDVYGLVEETLTTGACGHDGCTEHTGWVEGETIWGFYGHEGYLQDAAPDYFDGYPSKTETVTASV